MDSIAPPEDEQFANAIDASDEAIIYQNTNHSFDAKSISDEDDAFEMTPEERDLQEEIYRMCPEIQDCIDNRPDVTDIDMDGYGNIFIKSINKNEKSEYDFLVRMKRSDAEKIILSYGAMRGHSFNERSSLKTLWVGGHRAVLIYGDVVDGPMFHIRIARNRSPRLLDMIDQGSVTKNQAATMVHAIRNHKNIIFCGLPGSGKTTIQLALGKAYTEVPWLVIIVDPQQELRIKCPNVRRVYPKANYSEIDALDDALLRDPGAIGYGEVRLGPSGVQLIRVWMTGVCGSFCTVHADSVESVLPRFATFYRECNMEPVYSDLAQTIHYIVHCVPQRVGTDRKFQIQRMARVESEPFPKSLEDFHYIDIP